jgi:hypothetical protein
VCNVDIATLAVIKEKGVACPTYVAGRDFEILGAPGRLAVFLATFVLAVGLAFSLKRWFAARNQTRFSPG